ncbi:MAG: pyridoxal-phosphate dependent enzyme, partial [Chthonomonadaceae bacterium]|nr:pyridoxal-phosphate dependent enzyme [Chthonomonadaceae bacterium]
TRPRNVLAASRQGRYRHARTAGYNALDPERAEDAMNPACHTLPDLHPDLWACIRPTTLMEAPRLSRWLGVEVLLACETFQHTGSFKFRAACNLALQVAHPHVLTASSGNFGQALACACQRMGKQCTVVMPDTSARVKVEAVREYGATVEPVDVRVMSRAARVEELARRFPEAFVASAYDDPFVIAGNASLGLELADVAGRLDAVIAPVGGGGLTSGLITGLCAAGQGLAVFGAEPAMANDAARSLRAGQLIRNDQEPQTIADGARNIGVGVRNWEILRRGIRAIVEVPEEAIREAVRLLFTGANLKAEPTGALAVGALLAAPERFRDHRVCCVISGGNVDPSVYCEILAGV